MAPPTKRIALVLNRGYQIHSFETPSMNRPAQRAQDRVQVKPFMDRPSGGTQALGEVFGGHSLNHG